MLLTLSLLGRLVMERVQLATAFLEGKPFFSNLSPSGVTCTSELQRTSLNDGRIVNVIDTPGLFDFSTGAEVIRGELVKCIDLAKDGIHAVLMVFSIGSRFTREEEAAVESMKSLFGDKIVNYMIIVFTGGDTLESKRKSLKDYIHFSPEPLKNIIQQCKNRVIIFNNTTNDKIKREGQVNELLSLVESAIMDNGGKPYSNKIFAKLKEGALLRDQKVKEIEAKEGCSKEESFELMKEIIKSYNDQLKLVTEMLHTMEADPINDLKLIAASNAINIVIVGKAGNGKSATGNSILGREAFFSNLSPSGVTELQRTILNDGRIINVIDTLGMFDFSTDFEVISGEIIKCIDLAKDGIHAVLMIFSIGSRFTREEEAAFESIKSLFGDKIINYMIIVFTGGDILESRKKCLKDYMSLFPETLRNIIQQCNNRVIVFDNTTRNMIKREGQVNELLSLVESAIVDNGGKPYSNKIFAELKE